MSLALWSRRRVARRLLVLEAGLLSGILGAFALLSLWLSGTASSEGVALVGLILMASLLIADSLLVRSHWKRLRHDSGGGERGP